MYKTTDAKRTDKEVTGEYTIVSVLDPTRNFSIIGSID